MYGTIMSNVGHDRVLRNAGGSSAKQGLDCFVCVARRRKTNTTLNETEIF